MKEVYNKYMNDEIKVDNLTKLGILALIIVIAGIFGFCIEFIFYYFNSGMKYFYYRGSNFLPWINIYAIGALAIFFLTYKYKKNKLKVFLISMVSCAIIEYLGGYLLYHFGNGFRCWDYNTEILNFGNIDGFICLRSVIGFGLSSYLLMYIITPFCYFLATKLNKKTFLIISLSLCSIFVIDELYNLLFARLFNLKRASDIYKKIGFKYMKF